jgi:hypothetical protein
MTSVGIDPTVINRIDITIVNGTFPNIHSLLIARHNVLVCEKYWPGKDQNWGNDRGVVAHSKDDLHDIRSISKSIVSACIGIAMQQGKIKSVDQKVFDFFSRVRKVRHWNEIFVDHKTFTYDEFRTIMERRRAI